ncbi:unnamed protein product [Nezara viridula]|uniref:Uncharacterized protein n=1 Tax=Nezara viridula TaxID=85310 RepID=A0A9P0H8E6_NEZVI|nr:unnamed protein product [Nezara viridula]
MNGAHTYGFNCGSIGIAFLGNFDVQYLSPEMEEAFHMIIEEGLKLGEIAEDYKLFGHLQLRNGSESPGVHAYDLKNKLCDISYNFVIAGDGYIYEGRGWGKYGDHTYGFDCDSIGIAFLGNYDLQHLTPKMISSFQLLVEEGLEMGEIAQDYKLFGHSQVRESKGPDLQPSLNFSLSLRSRKQWSQSKQKRVCDDLKIHPAKYVVLSHTVTSMCTNPISCQTTVIMIQSDHIRQGFCDIGYNFLIGGDDYIYEGLGWGKYGAHTYGFNCDSIGIAFIGNFNLDYPTDKMIQLYNLIIEEGLRLNQLARDYKLIAQKQVNSFASPGIHIEEVMTKWDHWSLVTPDDYLCKPVAN